MTEQLPTHYDAFHPGAVWLDTAGKRIEAHGGSMHYEDGVYYWYGENKERSTGTGIWHLGMKAYSSTDLYNWEDRGLIVPPHHDDPSSSLHPASMADRPHIVRSPHTGKYVCWIKIMSRTSNAQTMTILTADSFLGPYTIVREGYRPAGFTAGDFDMAVDSATGKGYIYFEHPHSEMISAELTDDFTATTGTHHIHFPGRKPPLTREAPAHFQRNGKHYLVTSGTTGYWPNPSMVAVADSWHGPFTALGDPHPHDRWSSSNFSQVSCVFKVQGADDLYIAMADRWLPRLTRTPWVPRLTARKFERQFRDHDAAPAGVAEEEHEPWTDRTDTSEANYVWLPLRFQDDMAFLDWHRAWRHEDFS